MLTVSAIIPTHRRPGLLADAIASVQAQTMLPCELVVVDDADDGETRAVVAAAGRAAPFPVRYIANGDGGVCRSRNLGARVARGDWLAFLDDDDIWRSDFLQRLTGCLAPPGEKDTVDFALSGLLRHECGRNPVSRSQAAGLRSDAILRHRASMTGSNAIIARRAFFAVGGFDPAMAVFNDWDMLVRLVDAERRYAVVDLPLAEWRDHDGPRIATPSPSRANGIERFLARYRHRLSPPLRRELSTTALGIRLLHAPTIAERMTLRARLIAAHGVGGSWRRGVERVRRWRDHSRPLSGTIAPAVGR